MTRRSQDRIRVRRPARTPTGTARATSRIAASMTRPTIVWHLAWSATNGQGGDLGDLTGPAAAFGLRVEESQALVSGTGQ